MILRLFVVLIAAAVLFTAVVKSHARDNEAWDSQPPAVRAWFAALKQPDNPYVSCCGEADAYWADDFEIKGDEYVAVITDERVIPGRTEIAPGTRIGVPNIKIKFDKGNPTGHGIIFVRSFPQGDGFPDGYTVFCYLPPAGG